MAAKTPAMLAPPSPLLRGSSSQGQLLRAPARPKTPPQAAEGAPTSPVSDGDKKNLDKERQEKQACKKMWTIGSSIELQIQEKLEQLIADNPEKKPKDLIKQVDLPRMRQEMKRGGKLDWKNPDWDGATLLLKAIRTDNTALAKWIVAKGGDPTIPDNSGRNALHWAASGDINPEIMSYLLETVPMAPALVNNPDEGGDTPLHIAAYHGNLPAVRLLIRHSAETTNVNAEGFTPQDLAEGRRMWHVANYLTAQREQEEDKANAELEIRNIVRKCNLDQANLLKATGVAQLLNLANKPKPAPKKK